MTEEQQLKLQAFVDRELPETEKREVVAWLERDADATALANELRNTREAFADYGKTLKLPESREFYWSKIQREINRPQPAAAPVESTSWLSTLRRALVPAGALAALAIAVIVAVHPFGGGMRPIQVNSMLADAGAFTYRDDAQGMTVIWLSYPAQKTLAENKSGDTLHPE